MASKKSAPSPAKQRILQELNSIEKDVKRYRKPEVALALKASTLDSLWEIFGTSVIKPDAAPFVIGRMYQAFEPYREMVFALKKYEELETKLANLERAEEIAAESNPTEAKL